MFSSKEMSSDRLILKRLNCSICGGLAVVFTMGFYLSWDSLILFYLNILPFGERTLVHNAHLIICWHVAFIIGAIFAAFVVRLLSKSTIYYIAGILVTISGALLIVPPSEGSVPLTIAKYLGGIAQGIALLTVIVHSSEIATAKNRGRLVGEISFVIAGSLFIAFAGAAYLEDELTMDFSINMLFGIFTVIIGIIGLFLTRFMTLESPVFLLNNNRLNEARIILAKLRLQDSESWPVNEELGELQKMVKDEQHQNVNILADGNALVLLQVAIFRGIFTAATLAIVNGSGYFLLSTLIGRHGLMLVSLFRFISEGICLHFVDKWRRPSFLLISCMGCGIIFLIIGCISIVPSTHALVTVSSVAFMFYGLFVGCGLGPMSIIYMGEAFPIKKKPLSVLIVILIEQLVHIIALVCYYYAEFRVEALFNSIGLVLILSVFCTLPDTAGRSISETVNIVKDSQLRKLCPCCH